MGYAAETEAKYKEINQLRKQARWESGDYSLLMVAGLMLTAEHVSDAFKRVEAKILELDAIIESLATQVTELQKKVAEPPKPEQWKL